MERGDKPGRSERADAIALSLQVVLGHGVAADQLDTVTRELEAEIAESGLGNARLATRPRPPGSKGGVLAVVGTLLVTAVPNTLPQLMALLHSWTFRSTRRSLTLRGHHGGKAFELALDAQGFSGSEIAQALGALVQASERQGSGGDKALPPTGG